MKAMFGDDGDEEHGGITHVDREYYVPIKGSDSQQQSTRSHCQTSSSCQRNNQISPTRQKNYNGGGDEDDNMTIVTKNTNASSSSTTTSTVFSMTSEYSPLIPPRGTADENSSDSDGSDRCSVSHRRSSISNWFFVFVLGFSHHPLKQRSSDEKEEGTIKSRNTKASDMRLAMLSNFSTAYNVVSISLALSIMENVYDSIGQSKSENKSLCSSALIAGMIIGQLIGGVIGDILGRHVAMAVVMTLQVVGAIMSAFSFEMRLVTDNDGDTDDRYGTTIPIYVVLALWRFILGVGCGGVYPLAATITAESVPSPSSDNIRYDNDCDGDAKASSSKTDASKSVALSFSMQGIGYLVGPLVGWGLVSLLDEQSDLSWRLLLGFGAVPGLFLMTLRLQRQMSIHSSLEDVITSKKVVSTSTAVSKHANEQEAADLVLANTRQVPVSVFDAIMLEEDLVRKLLGTAGCWFAFDVLFYGNVLFQPVVLSAAFGPTETLAMTAMHTVLVSSLALPGYFVSVIMIGHQSPRVIQAQGFLVMGILYAFIGIIFHDLEHQKALMIVLYGSTFFFSNYGPNATTYLLPSMTFSKSCRATLNGVSAASGKVGALLGTMVFVAAADRFGEQVVMWACAVISFAGVVLTVTCVSEKVLHTPTKEEQHRQNEAEKRLPMKVIFSEPSLIDYYNSANNRSNK
jgi:MFS transporter, PHS family, inorganic phosphate transporter